MINLPNVEIISINTHNPIQSVKAIEYSCMGMNFGRKRLFTDVPMKVDGIEVVNIPKFTTREAYSNFCIHELHRYIDYEFTLMIHDDGFVINPELWTDEFLEYDYIGAPWPGDANSAGRVGNGGFTLRSKKLFDSIKSFTEFDINEDWLIGVIKRTYLDDIGIKFAPVEVACKFSLELPIEECEYNLNNTFGFHGKRSVQHYHKIEELNSINVEHLISYDVYN